MIKSFRHKGLQSLKLMTLSWSTILITTSGRRMVQMFNPPHPGEVLLDGVFSETGISTADFAGRIGRSALLLSLEGELIAGCSCRTITNVGSKRIKRTV